MLYSLARILMRTGLRFFYRHIYVTGLEHIPSQGPVIIIANHPSSLMDAALLGILLKRKPWFFTRGDVFINKPVQKVLSWLHMLPVHQHEKGRSSLSANDNSFAAAEKILSHNGIIVFFPESTSHEQRQLWPFRKGVFRLAFQTMATHNFSFPIPIVPIGITYDHPTAGRQCVQVHVGAPLQAADYAALYQSHPAAALAQIVKDAQNHMHRQVLHVLRIDRCAVAENYLIVQRNSHPYPPYWKIPSRSRLQREQAICHCINRAGDVELAALQQRSAVYFDALERYGLEDETIAGRPFKSWKYLLLLIGIPPYLFGMLFNGLPVLIARRIADKKVLREDFYSWIFVCCYTVLYFLWIILATGIAIPLLGWLPAITLLAEIGLAGLFCYKYIDWMHEAKQQGKLRRLSAQELEALRKMRSDITSSTPFLTIARS